MRLRNATSALRSTDETGDATDAPWPRRLAVVAGIVLIASFLHVPFHITDVVGGTGWLLVVVASAALAGTLAARTLPLRPALLVGVSLLGFGMGAYAYSLPDAYTALLSRKYLVSLVRLGLGALSLVEITQADLWAISIAPAPVFATWYLVLRRHYDLGAWVGGLTLGFFILTGDATQPVALVGVTSAMGVLGFGHLEQAGGTWHHVREVGVLLAAAIVVTRLVRPVTARLLRPADVSSHAGDAGASPAVTLEGSLLDASEQLAIQGSISLSPTARFTVSADRPAYWRAAAYDRFTGTQWVRTGNASAYADALPSPPGETAANRQQYVVESAVDTMPAAWKPIQVDADVADRTQVTEFGGLQPTESFSAGASYAVTSEQPTASDAELRDATGSPPAEIRERYLQYPDSTPGRVGRLAADLAADHDTRFEQAAAIEQWLQQTKSYSLDVTRPPDNIADTFIFDMPAGYCVYFATAMVVMLRTLEIPARFVVGYSTGQQVGAREWVVRGFDSHAWVEVYFPEIGWVSFDPTPGGPRQRVRQRRLQDARDSGASDVDTAQSRPTTTTTTPENGTSTTASPTDQPTTTAPAQSPTTTGPADQQGLGGAPTTQRPQSGVSGQSSSDSSRVSRRSLFTRLSRSDQLALGAGVLGVVLGVSRLDSLKRGLRFLSVAWQPATPSPRRDVERAFDRLETVLARQYRPRQDGETRREYFEAIQETPHRDDRLHRLLELYEHAVYRDGATRTRADEARELVTQLVHDHSNIPSW